MRIGPAARRGVAALCAAFALAGCSVSTEAVDTNNGGAYRFVEAQPAGEVVPVADRQPAPEFAGKLLDGSAFESTSLDGSVAVLNFWGSWCPPCRVESPQFQEVYAAHQADGVQFLGINVKDSDQLARGFVDDKGITFPSVFDPRSEVALAFRDYPAEAIPSTIVLDAEYRVAAVYIGEIAKADLEKVLATVLAEDG